MENTYYKADGVIDRYVISKREGCNKLMVFLAFSYNLQTDYNGDVYGVNKDGDAKAIYNIAAYEDMAEMFVENSFYVMRMEMKEVKNPDNGLEDFILELEELIHKAGEELDVKDIYLFAVGEACELAVLLAEKICVKAMLLLCGAGMSMEAQVRYIRSHYYRWLLKVPVLNQILLSHYRALFQKDLKKAERTSREEHQWRAYYELLCITEDELFERLKSLSVPIFAGYVQHDLYCDREIAKRIEQLQMHNITVEYFPHVDFTLRTCSYIAYRKELTLMGYCLENMNYSKSADQKLKEQIKCWLFKQGH